jgi:hypothetical protein
VTTSGEFGVEVTEDRARILREIDLFEDRHDPFRRTGNLLPPGSVGGAPNLGMMTSEMDLGRFFGSVGSYKVVEDVARVLGANDGRRKAVIWISAGVELADQAMRKILADVQCADNVVSKDGGPITKDNAVSLGGFSTRVAWFCDSIGGLLENLRRASVTTYTVNPGGPRDGGSSLDLIAGETGGFGVAARDLEAGLARVIADIDNYYLLGFYPAEVKGSDYRPIDVRVKRPGLTVRHRRGYSARGAQAPPKNASALGRLVAGVMPSTDLSLRLQAVPLASGGSEAHVAVGLEVDLERFPEGLGGDPFEDTIEYGIFAADLDRKRVTVGKTRTLEMRWSAADRARTGAARFQVRNVIDLPPGRYQLRASAISSGLDRGGSVYLLLDVPDVDDAPVAVASLALAAAGREDAHPRIVDSVVRPGWPLPFAPSLDRSFMADDAIRLFFQVRRRSPDLPGVAVITVQDMTGREVLRRTVDVSGAEITSHEVTLPLAGLAPGGYALLVAAGDDANRAGQRLGFTIEASNIAPLRNHVAARPFSR